MKITKSIFTLSLVLFISSKPPHLFGNGCIAANNQLFMVAFAQINTEERHDGYYMNIPTITTPKEKIEIEWKSEKKDRIFPGEMVKVEGKPSPTVYYILNQVSPSEFIANVHQPENSDLPTITEDSIPISNDTADILKGSNETLEVNEFKLNDPSLISNDTSSLSKDQSNFNITSKLERRANSENPNPKYTPENLNGLKEEYFNLYQVYLPKDIRIAVAYNQMTYFLDDPSNVARYGDILNSVAIQNQDGSIKVHKTQGDIPVNKKGFSATIHDNLLFVTGGELDNSDTDSIYVLDLVTLKWSKHTVSNFHGARSGCLSYSDGYLIHAFGIKEGSYLSTTQFVDTKDWSLVQAYNTADEVSSSDSSILIPVVVGISCGVLLIIIIIFLFIYLKRRRTRTESETVLYPPEYITKSIWAEPRYSRFEMDTRLTTDNSELAFDTISSPTGSTNQLIKKSIYQSKKLHYQ